MTDQPNGESLAASSLVLDVAKSAELKDVLSQCLQLFGDKFDAAKLQVYAKEIVEGLTASVQDAFDDHLSD